MSVNRYNKLVKDNHESITEAAEEPCMIEAGVGVDELACEIASHTVAEEKWVTQFLTSRGVSDVVGCLADDFAYCNLVE